MCSAGSREVSRERVWQLTDIKCDGLQLGAAELSAGRSLCGLCDLYGSESTSGITGYLKTTTAKGGTVT